MWKKNISKQWFTAFHFTFIVWQFMPTNLVYKLGTSWYMLTSFPNLMLSFTSWPCPLVIHCPHFMSFRVIRTWTFTNVYWMKFWEDNLCSRTHIHYSVNTDVIQQQSFSHNILEYWRDFRGKLQQVTQLNKMRMQRKEDLKSNYGTFWLPHNVRFYLDRIVFGCLCVFYLDIVILFWLNVSPRHAMCWCLFTAYSTMLFY